MQKKILFFIFNLVLVTGFVLSENLIQDTDFIIKTSRDEYVSGDTVVFTATSPSPDFKKRDFFWMMNGVVVESGFGKDSVSLTIPGNESFLQVETTDSLGLKQSNIFSIYQKGLSLYYEALDSYVPAWYEGKPLVTRGGSVRVYAVPNIFTKDKKINNSDLYFEWESDNKINVEASGYGKNYYEHFIRDTSRSEVEISVSVSQKNSNQRTSKTINIPVRNTELLVYVKDLEEGLSRALTKNTTLITKNFSLVAEPFYYANSGSTAVNWYLRNRVLGSGFVKNFKVPENVSEIILRVSGSHNKNIFQENEESFIINF